MNPWLLFLGAIGIVLLAGPAKQATQEPLPPSKPKAEPPKGTDYKSVFIARAWDDAEAVAKEAGWPRDLLLTQSAHESDWGRSGLASKYNNLFGIKDGGRSAMGGKVTPPMPTWEEKNGVPYKTTAIFRAYDSWGDSMRDLVAFLKKYPRYVKALEAAANGNAQGFFTALREAGYATDSKYDTKLAGIYQIVQRSIA